MVQGQMCNLQQYLFPVLADSLQPFHLSQQTINLQQWQCTTQEHDTIHTPKTTTTNQPNYGQLLTNVCVGWNLVDRSEIAIRGIMAKPWQNNNKLKYQTQFWSKQHQKPTFCSNLWIIVNLSFATNESNILYDKWQSQNTSSYN